MIVRAAKSALLLSALLAGSLPAASLLTNGSFENPPCPNAFCTVTAVNGIAGWDLMQGSVDVVTNSYWLAHSGSQSVDLNGNAPAVIRQSVNGLEVGAFYTLEFFLSGNPDWTSPPNPWSYRLTIEVGDGLGSQTFVRDFSMAGVSRPDITWARHQIYFAAPSSTVQISFSGDATSGPYGPVLDDAGLYYGTPEPGSVTLFAVGAAGLWLARRRLKK